MTELEKLVQLEANRCVKCGLCLPKCPTYAVTQHEAESPRGRIALLDALATSLLPYSDKAITHLDNCLTCRACEAVCPSEVAYGKLIAHGREMIQKHHTSSPHSTTVIRRIIYFLLQKPRRFLRFTRLLYYYQQSGLKQWLARKNFFKKSVWGRLSAYLPLLARTKKWQTYYPASNHVPYRGAVGLFHGCLSPSLDPNTMTAIITLLTQCGYHVYNPSQQTCCGAIHLNSGQANIAKNLATININTFQTLPIDHIVHFVSGCGATLQEYQTSDNNFIKKLVDINYFLNHIELPKSLKFKALSQRVAIHTPCTLRNVLRQTQEPYTLLKNIPNIELVDLNSSAYCCGAAGTYMLEKPEMADTLLDKTLSQLNHLKPDIIVTTNIGCCLHLIRGLKERNQSIRVIHPVTLLVEQLNF